MAPNALTAKKTFPSTINNLNYQVRNLRSIVGSLLSNISSVITLVSGGLIKVQDGSGNVVGEFGWDSGSMVLRVTGTMTITGNASVSGNLTTGSNSTINAGNLNVGPGTTITSITIGSNGSGPTLNISH